MSKGKYTRTKIHRKHISEALIKKHIMPPSRKGSVCSIESNLKRSKSLKENAKINLNFGMRGKQQSVESNLKRSKKLRGRECSWYNKIVNVRKLKDNYFMSKEAKIKLSATLQNIPLSEWKNFARQEYDDNWTERFKNLIRKRDNQICMNCGIHREKLNKALIVHHINYDKKCSIEQNCISLCESCYRFTLGNRQYWINLFQTKLSILYGYKYMNNIIEVSV